MLSVMSNVALAPVALLVVAMGRRARSLDGGRQGRQPRSGHPRAATWAAGRLTGRQGQRVDHVVDVVARNARPAKEVEGGTPSDGYGSEVTAPAIKQMKILDCV